LGNGYLFLDGNNRSHGEVNWLQREICDNCLLTYSR
jgi:hypothetical protein